MSVNRGKKSVTIDIASARGQQLIRDLAQASDVMIENFKVGGLAKIRPRLRAAEEDQSAPRLLLDHRLRPDRPLRQARRLRLRRAGHGRADEHHRPAGRDAGRRPRQGRRRHLRRDVGPERAGRHPRRPGAPRAHGRGRLYRDRAARCHGRRADQHRFELPRHRRGAGAARQRPPHDRPLRGVPDQGRPHHPGDRQRRPVRALLRGGRPRSSGAPTSASPPIRSASPIGRRWSRSSSSA